jgi:hypothetical protein
MFRFRLVVTCCDGGAVVGLGAPGRRLRPPKITLLPSALNRRSVGATNEPDLGNDDVVC